MKVYLGVDVGSVSTNLALINDNREVVHRLYLRTSGKPIEAVQRGLRMLKEEIDPALEVAGVGTTGSARKLIGLIVGADVVKNEITAHAVAALQALPGVQTVIEIGGQDSKIIILRDGVVVDFAMNSVCAAGTGSFLDQQANRLDIPIEDFGKLALQSKSPVRIAGRCGVFAESDMIHKQQVGHSTVDIIAGLCEALARNYLNNVAKGKEIKPPIIFQGGVAANVGMKAAFEKFLETEVVVPDNFDVMGAIGAAILAKEYIEETGSKTNFGGFEVSELDYQLSSFICKGCPNRCEVVKMSVSGDTLAYWGDRCGKWQNVKVSAS